MKRLNIKNEVIKRSYLRYLREAEGLSEITITGIEQAVNLFEGYTKNLDFSKITSKKIVEFKGWLNRREVRGKRICLTTYKTYLKYIKKYFLWLSHQPGYKSKIKSDIIEYFNIPRKENRIAAINQRVKFPSIEYCIKLVNSVVGDSEVDMRDKALIAFTTLTGMRDRAIVSLPLCCIDEIQMIVRQDPSAGVETKFTKYIISKIFEIDPHLVSAILLWVKYLKNKGFSPNDPLFPRSKDNQTEIQLSFQSPIEVEPIFWQSTSSIRLIFKKRSKQAGLDYYPPRAIRHTTVNYVIRNARNGQELKALSQHFGHEDVKTILQIYGNFGEDDLIDVLGEIKFNTKPKQSLEDLEIQIDQLKDLINDSNPKSKLKKDRKDNSGNSFR